MKLLGLPDFPRFEWILPLGKGGMGEVYEVRDRESNAHVALKLLRLSKRGDDIQRFKNEFRYLQGVRHPNLVRLLELMET